MTTETAISVLVACLVLGVSIGLLAALTSVRG